MEQFKFINNIDFIIIIFIMSSFVYSFKNPSSEFVDSANFV